MMTRPEQMRRFGPTRDPFGAPCEPGELWPAADLAPTENLPRYGVPQGEIVAILGDIGKGRTTPAFAAMRRRGAIARPIAIGGE